MSGLSHSCYRWPESQTIVRSKRSLDFVRSRSARAYPLEPELISATEINTIRFAGWISGRIVRLQLDTDIQKLLSNRNRISETLLSIFRGSDFWKKLHIAQSFIHYLQKHLSSLQCHDFESVYIVISVPWCNPIPPLTLLIGHAKFVSMNLFLVWQDRALSVYIKDRRATRGGAFGSAGSRKYFFCSAKRKSATKIEFVCSASVKRLLRNSPHPQFKVKTFGCLAVD